MSDLTRELPRTQAVPADTALAPPSGLEHLASQTRPPFHPEEGASDSSDWWSLAKAVLVGVVVLMLLGWLLSA